MPEVMREASRLSDVETVTELLTDEAYADA